MAIPPVNQPPRPTRIGTEFIRGKGLHQPEASPIADAPNSGKNIPSGPVMLGMDIQVGTFAIPILNADQSTPVVVTLALPALPTISVGTTDQLVAHCTVQSSLDTRTGSGLTVSSDTAVATALPMGGSNVSGPVFMGGFNYSNWGALYSATVANTTGAPTKATTLYITVQVQLYLYTQKANFNATASGVGSSGVPVGGSFSSSGSAAGSGTNQSGSAGGAAPPGGGKGGRPPI